MCVFFGGSIEAAAWRLRRPRSLPKRTWSEGQARWLDAIRSRISIEDANFLKGLKWHDFHADGEPGLGKTDAVIYAASGIAQQSGRVPQLACWSAAIATNFPLVTAFLPRPSWRVARDADLKTYLIVAPRT